MNSHPRRTSVTRPRAEEPADAARSDNALRALVRSFGLLRRVMDPYFARYGISASQWGVLRALHRSEEEGLHDLRLTDLGDRLLVRPPSVTVVVERLRRMGLVRRSASPTDQRAKHVKLTPAGRRLLRRVLRGHPDQVGSMLDGLSDAEQKQLRRLLDRLATHLQSMAREHDGSED